MDSSGVALGTSWLFRPLCKDEHPQTPILFILVFPSPPTKFSLWFPPRAWPPQPAGITAGLRRESGKSKNQPGGGRYKLVLAGREHMGRRKSAVAGGRLLRAPARPLPAWQPQPTDLTARKANFSRESRRISREDVGTSRSSPLASTRAAGNQRSTSQRAPAPCPPGSRNPPTSRPQSANFSRESRRISREDVSTSRSSPLARLRAVAWQLSPPCPAPTSRPLTFH